MDVFLSYARDEREKVQKIAEALRALGLGTFVDVEGGIEAGDSFPQRISDAVRNAKVVLACWSRHALSRDWVRRECMMARDLGKLVAVAVDTLSPTDLPAEFYDTSFEDLTGYTAQDKHWGWSQTCKALAARLESWADARAGDSEAPRSLDLASKLRKAALAARPADAEPTGGIVAAKSAAARAWESLKDGTDWRKLLEFGGSFPGTEEGFLATKRGNEIRQKEAKAYCMQCMQACQDRLQSALDACRRDYGATGPSAPLYEQCRKEAFAKYPPGPSNIACEEETRRRFGDFDLFR